MKYFIIFLLLASCGKQKVEVSDSKHVVDGETKTRILFELPFINQVRNLCRDLNLKSDFESDELWKQEVAKCTFENISILNIGDISPEGFEDVLTDICSNPEYQNEPICL